MFAEVVKMASGGGGRGTQGGRYGAGRGKTDAEYLSSASAPTVSSSTGDAADF